MLHDWKAPCLQRRECCKATLWPSLCTSQCALLGSKATIPDTLFACRALNAVKLNKVFAKPFLAALPHDDGVICLARSPTSINCLLSGCADGEIRWAWAGWAWALKGYLAATSGFRQSHRGR